MDQCVISLWWHKHFEKHTVWFNLSFSSPILKKILTQLSCALNSRSRFLQGQSRWLTSMRGALSVTLQAFHYKKCLTIAQSQDGECSCLEAGWVKEPGFTTHYLRLQSELGHSDFFVSPLSFQLVMWHGSSSSVSQRDKMGHERFGFAQRRWYSSHNSFSMSQNTTEHRKMTRTNGSIFPQQWQVT